VDPFTELTQATRRLRFEPYAVDQPVDAEGRYQRELDGDFPFEVKLLSFASDMAPRPQTWHTYLELFVPVSGGCRLRMGGAVVELEAGDVLVVDHLKLHSVEDLTTGEMRAVVIRFLPELVRGLVARTADTLSLVPFYCQIEGRPHVLRRPSAAAVHQTLAALLDCAFDDAQGPYREGGVRAFFLVVLHHLARHFGASDTLRSEYFKQQQKAKRLSRLFDHVHRHFGERIGLGQAARIAGLSRPQFTKLFREASGTTFVAYLLKVRLAHAGRLLLETERPIADIAFEVGFEDPSYFDRRFRAHFGRTPLEYRRSARK